MNAALPTAPLRKLTPTPGGVHPPENKAQSLALPQENLASPPEIILPLSQHLGAPAQAVVAVGDKVKQGQLVAAAQGNISANVHASISGTVSAIESRPIAHPSGMSDTCIVITNDYLNESVEYLPCVNFRQLHTAEIMQRIEAAGVVGMGGAGFPTTVKLQAKQKISTLIINATECEPYITADDSLMRNAADDVLGAIGLLDYILAEPTEILIAIEDNKPEAIAQMRETATASGNNRIEIVVLPTKYPSGGEKQLIQMLTGKELSNGQLPADFGIICQNIATVVAAYYAVVKGEPLIKRIVTVAGNALARQQNLVIPIGTPIEFVLMQQGLNEKNLSRLVMGGPMMGFTLTDTNVPVVKTTNCLLALDKEESPPQQPAMACIRCGMCAEACPASLLPQQLYWYARAQDQEKLQAYNLFDCIECGACSYACPSHIPLVQYYRSAKAEIRITQLEKQHSDRARQRFEFHKQRVEAEKEARAEAKRIAAEKAAAKAKQRAEQEQQAPTPRPKPDTAEDDPAKLERNLATLEDRLQKLRDKIDAGELSDDQVRATTARIKESELKRDKLLQRLGQNAVSDQPQAIQDSSENPRLAQWQNELKELREKIGNTADTTAESLAALKLAEQVLQDKINNVLPNGGQNTTKFSGGTSEDRLQRAMEEALSKSPPSPSGPSSSGPSSSGQASAD